MGMGGNGKTDCVPAHLYYMHAIGGLRKCRKLSRMVEVRRCLRHQRLYYTFELNNNNDVCDTSVLKKSYFGNLQAVRNAK